MQTKIENFPQTTRGMPWKYKAAFYITINFNFQQFEHEKESNIKV